MHANCFNVYLPFKMRTQLIDHSQDLAWVLALCHVTSPIADCDLLYRIDNFDYAFSYVPLSLTQSIFRLRFLYQIRGVEGIFFIVTLAFVFPDYWLQLPFQIRELGEVLFLCVFPLILWYVISNRFIAI